MHVLSKLAALLISPFGAALLALLCAAWGAQRLARAFGMVAMIWAWLWATPAFSNGLCLQLEAGYPPMLLNDMTGEKAAVVGGAISPPSATRPFANLQICTKRLTGCGTLRSGGDACD